MTNPTPHGQVPEALLLADQYAAAHANWALEALYGSSKSYTAEKLAERHAARAKLERALHTQQPASPTPPAEQQAQPGAVGRTGCTAGTDEECTRRGCATRCPAQQAAPKAAPGEPPGIQALMCVISSLHSLRDTAHFSDEEGELTNDLCTLRDWAYAQTAAFQPSPKAAPGEQFDPEGFRAWVLRNLPDDTIIGSSAWWADHLTTWAQRFMTAAPQQEVQEPAAFIHWPINGPPRLVWYSQKALNDAILKTHEDGYKPDVKLYTAPQPAPAPLSESEYKRGYRDGYERRDAEVRGALV